MAKRKSALNLPHPVLNTGCHNRHATIDLATQNIYIVRSIFLRFFSNL